MGAVNTDESLAEIIEHYHQALGDFMRGNHRPAQQLFSERDDVTLGNPFGPFARGWNQVVETMERAARHYRDGEAAGFDRISESISGDLAYVVEVERLRSKVGGQDEIASVDLRVTTIFRREDGRWKIVHRHADPITTAQTAESVIQRS